MSGNSVAHRGLDKRKACVFLILVAVGVLCICALAYMLFFATPHSNNTIKNGGHSLARMMYAPAPPDWIWATGTARLPVRS